MPELVLFQAIEHSEHFGSVRLFTRTIDTPFCPQKGDRIVLFPYEVKDPSDGPMGTVKEVYWHHDGTVAADLEHFVQDPDENMERQVRISLNTNHLLHSWYSQSDGDLAQRLMFDGGWLLYGG